MRYAALVLLCLTLPGCAGQQGESRSYELRHVEADYALVVLRRLENDLGESVRVTMRPNSPVLTLQGDPEHLERAVALLRDIDRPQPMVRFRFQLVEADGFATADSAIADVESVLRDLFRFRGYRLAAEAVAQGEAPGHIRQLIGQREGMPVFVNVDVTRVVASDSASAVSLTVDLSVGNTSILGTSLTVPGGKTAVVGSARTLDGGSTLILVVRPEIL